MPARTRARVVGELIWRDLAVAIPLGIWGGLLVSLGMYTTLGVCGTLAAGTRLRRDGRLLRALPGYFEVVLPVTIGGVQIYTLAMAPLLGGRLSMPLWYFLAVFLLAALALVAVARGWPWPVRLLLHAGWFSLLCLSSWFTLPV